VREIHQDWHLWSVEDDPSTEQVLGVHGARGDVAQRGRFEILRRRLPRHFQIVGKRDHARRRPRGLGLRPHHPEELRVVPDRRRRHHQRVQKNVRQQKVQDRAEEVLSQDDDSSQSDVLSEITQEGMDEFSRTLTKPVETCLIWRS
jgi:hypothetical protein